ncbi:MAG: DNA translocase FtsK, partial [Rhodoblastus sp.]
MNFDAWIAKMLDALKDESGGKQSRRRNVNPVMICEIGADGRPQSPPRQVLAPFAPTPVAPASFAPAPLAPAPVAPPLARIGAMAPPPGFAPPAPAVPASPQPPAQPAGDSGFQVAAGDSGFKVAVRPSAKEMDKGQRPGLTARTATGDIRYSRTSEAELARRKNELRRLESERRAQEDVDAAARIERQTRQPGWVRFSRTPDRKPAPATTNETAPETAGEAVPAEIVAMLPAEQPLPLVAQAPETTGDASATGAGNLAARIAVYAGHECAPEHASQPEVLAALPAEDDIEAARPLVEILIPRSPHMARTEFFLGDSAPRVVIEEFDAPELRLAPPMPRIHPRVTSVPRNELHRLAALLVSSAISDAEESDEDARAVRLHEAAPPRAPEAAAPATPEEKRRVRVKAHTQAVSTHTTPDAPTPATPVIARSAEAGSDRHPPEAGQSIRQAPENGGSLHRDNGAVSRDDRKTFRAKAPLVGDYEAPSLGLLREQDESDFAETAPEILEENARELEGVLDDFGVKGEIVNVRPGPVVTLYELEPAPGVKSSRVIGLADDIARSMSAMSARVAVVQGRNAIGVELPNQDRETVYLRELLASADFEGSKHRLAIALGKTIGGEPVIVDLARMPHLLVAGTTGSGKSVAINTMILSLLYRLKPEQCRLIMVDPKMLELSVYDGIP